MESLVTVALAIVGVGMVAVLVSRNANTSGVLAAAGGSLGTALTAAEGPVLTTGSSIGWTGGAPVDLGSF